MNWFYFSLACLCFWTPTGIFLGKANGAHGFVLTFHVQTFALVLFSIVLQLISPPNLALVTKSSMMFSVANGICSGFAYVFFLKAFEAAPGNVPEIELLTALYPVTCVFLIWFIQQMWPVILDEIVKIGLKEIAGVVLIAAGFTVFFWQPYWTDWLKESLHLATAAR